MSSLGKIIAFVMLLALGAEAQAAVVVNEADVADALRKEFVEQGNEDEMEFEFFGGKTNFVIEEAVQAKVMISRLQYDEAQNKFSATAEIFADGVAHSSTVLSGRYYVLEEVFVPAKNIEKGERISADKLKTIKVRRNRLKGGHITEVDKLSGVEAKRSLKAGKLVTDRDIGEVIVLKKGKVVTSIYKAKAMQITAQAEALENGAVGKRIELMNTKSGKKFFARVIDADTVEIDGQ